MKNILKYLIPLVISAKAFASLPPTTTKFSGDSNPVVTFEFDFPNTTVTHTGTKASWSVLGVAGGGTGASTLTSNNVLLGNGTSAVQFVAPGSSGNVLTSNGTTWTSSSPGTGTIRISWVTFGGASNPSNCTSSPCTIYNQSGDFSSITRNSTGDYTANFTGSPFSVQPSCSWSAVNIGGLYIAPNFVSNMASTSTAHVTSPSLGAIPTDVTGSIICVGTK